MFGEKGLEGIAMDWKRAISTVPMVIKVCIVLNATKEREYLGKRPSRITAG
ncbi:MAG: hypothetical protein ABSC14_01720 [Desulfomonilia bacterium]